MFINVNKTYDFDNLTVDNIEELIELKLKKEKEKLILSGLMKALSLKKVDGVDQLSQWVKRK